MLRIVKVGRIKLRQGLKPHIRRFKPPVDAFRENVLISVLRRFVAVGASGALVGAILGYWTT
jgi:hypothetical protein